MVEVVGSELRVMDARDGKVYWMTKLADGYGWMTQDLDLELSVTVLTYGSTVLYMMILVSVWEWIWFLLAGL